MEKYYTHIAITFLLVRTTFALKASYTFIKSSSTLNPKIFDISTQAGDFNSIFVNPNEFTKPEYFGPERAPDGIKVDYHSYPFVYSFKENFFPGVFSIAKHEAIMALYSRVRSQEFYLGKILNFFTILNTFNLTLCVYSIFKIFGDKDNPITQKIFGFTINIPVLVTSIILTSVISMYASVFYTAYGFEYCFDYYLGYIKISGMKKLAMDNIVGEFKAIALDRIRCITVRSKLFTATLNPIQFYAETYSGHFTRRNLISLVTSHFTSRDVISGKCHMNQFIDKFQKEHIIKKIHNLNILPANYTNRV